MAAGIAIGVAASILRSRLTASLLFGVTPRDPMTYAGVTAVLVAMAIVYSARRIAATASSRVAVRSGI